MRADEFLKGYTPKLLNLFLNKLSLLFQSINMEFEINNSKSLMIPNIYILKNENNTLKYCIDILDYNLINYKPIFSEDNSVFEKEQKQIQLKPLSLEKNEKLETLRELKFDIFENILQMENLIQFIQKQIPDLFTHHHRSVFEEICADNYYDSFEFVESDCNYFVLNVKFQNKRFKLKAEKFTDSNVAKYQKQMYETFIQRGKYVFVPMRIYKFITIEHNTYLIIEEEILCENKLNQNLQEYLDNLKNDEFNLIKVQILISFIEEMNFIRQFDAYHLNMNISNIYIDLKSEYYRLVFPDPLFLITKFKKNYNNLQASNFQKNFIQIFNKLFQIKDWIEQELEVKMKDQVEKLQKFLIQKFCDQLKEDQMTDKEVVLIIFLSRLKQYIYLGQDMVKQKNKSCELLLKLNWKNSLKYIPQKYDGYFYNHDINILQKVNEININLKDFNKKQLQQFIYNINKNRYLKYLIIKKLSSENDDPLTHKQDILCNLKYIQEIKIYYGNSDTCYINLNSLSQANRWDLIKIVFNSDDSCYVEGQTTNLTISKQSKQYLQIINKMQEINNFKKVKIVLDGQIFFSQISTLKQAILSINKYKYKSYCCNLFSEPRVNLQSNNSISTNNNRLFQTSNKNLINTSSLFEPSDNNLFQSQNNIFQTQIKNKYQQQNINIIQQQNKQQFDFNQSEQTQQIKENKDLLQNENRNNVINENQLNIEDNQQQEIESEVDDYLELIDAYLDQFDLEDVETVKSKLLKNINSILEKETDISCSGKKYQNNQKLTIKFKNTQERDFGELVVNLVLLEDDLYIESFDCRSVDKLKCLNFNNNELTLNHELVKQWLTAEQQTCYMFTMIGSSYQPQCCHCDYNLVQAFTYKHQMNLEQLHIGIMMCDYSVANKKFKLGFNNDKNQFYKLKKLQIYFKSVYKYSNASIKLLVKELKAIPKLYCLNIGVQQSIPEDIENDVIGSFKYLNKLKRITCIDFI